jgi:hypothetical protein
VADRSRSTTLKLVSDDAISRLRTTVPDLRIKIVGPFEEGQLNNRTLNTFRRTRVRLITGCILFAAFSFGTGQAMAESPTQIWLAPLDRFRASNDIGSTDYMELFDSNTTWKTVAEKVGIFKIYPFFTSTSPDKDLIALFAYLDTHNIRLALEGRALSDEGNFHGDGGEVTLHLLQRIKQLQGRVDYLAMDEPLMHWHSERSPIHASIGRIASNIADNVGRFRAIFPELKIGDIEPVGDWANQDGKDLQLNLKMWFDCFRQTTGQDLAFFHADVGWNAPWKKVVTEIANELHSRQIPFGIIYNGEDLAQTDDEWSAQAEQHFKEYEDGYASAPDAAIFQSWVAHPGRVLPENDGRSLTGIVMKYLLFRGEAVMK